MVGEWIIEPSENFPQKIATAISGKLEVFGCSYTPVLYLGHQFMNGTNHAVLAEQTVLCDKDVKNAVILIFNEKVTMIISAVSLASVIPVLQIGGELGGNEINVTTDIPDEAVKAFDNAVDTLVGAKFEILAYLGEQIDDGINYKLLVTIEAVAKDPVKKLALMTVNSNETAANVCPILQYQSLGYWIVKTSNGTTIAEDAMNDELKKLF